MAGGQTALALRLLLAVFSSKLSSDINRPFGDEVVEFKKQHINLFVYGINSLQFCSLKCSFVLLEKYLKNLARKLFWGIGQLR
jgi:hypothetical protein